MTEVYKSATSQSFFFELVDSTTGLPKTGIVYTDVTGSYVRTRSARVAITMATLASASAAWSSGGFVEVDATNQPGIYRLDVPDAAFATGVTGLVVTVKATGCRTQSRGFVLIDWNKQNAYVPITSNSFAASSIAAAAIATDAFAAAKFAANCFTATKFATGVLPTVALDTEIVGRYNVYVKDFDSAAAGTLASSPWTYATRTLTSLAGLSIDTVSGIDAAGATALRAALGLAAADLDTQLDAIAAGGGGATAAEVWAYVTRTLTGGVATYTGPVDPNTNAVSFVAGDAATPSWTASTTSFPTIVHGDATALRFLPKAAYRREGASAAAELEVTGTASISGSTITFSFTLTGTQTATLATVYPSSNAPTHQVQVVCTARDVTAVNAEATISRQIEASV